MSATWRVRLLTTGLWILVVSGPVLGLIALADASPAATSPPRQERPFGLAGLAELAVLAHLSTLPGTAPVWLSPAHPGLRLPPRAIEGLSTDQLTAAAQAVRSTGMSAAAVALNPAGPGRWGVTVAVIRDGRTEGWQVTVADTGTGLLVETLPALVALPTQQGPPTPAITPLRPPDPDDRLATAVSRFLSAYLSADGELQRYLSAEADVRAPPTPLAGIELRRIATGEVDDHHVAVLAETLLIGSDGGVQIAQYPLLMGRVDGRWEVQRLLPAVPVQPAVPVPQVEPARPSTSRKEIPADD
ncbi:MAG: hypothetical protein ACR2HR_16975 [Euzebya sp.]